MIATVTAASPAMSNTPSVPAALDGSRCASARSRLIRKIGTVTLIATSIPNNR